MQSGHLSLLFNSKCCQWNCCWSCNCVDKTPGYKNKLILIDGLWLVKMDGAAFIFIGQLSNTFLPGQFWPCLCFSALRHGLSPDFLISWTKAEASLLLWYKTVWWWGREIKFEWASSAVITVEDHGLQFENNYLKFKYCTERIHTCVFIVPTFGNALVSTTWGLFNLV